MPVQFLSGLPRIFFAPRHIACWLLLALCAGFHSPAPAQKAKVDSLQRILKQHPDDRKARRAWIVALRKINPDSALAICLAEADAAERRKDLTAAGDWNYYAAVTLDHLQKNKDAVPYFEKGISQLKSVRDTFSLDDCQNSFGYLLNRMGEYKEALRHYKDALAYREYVNDTSGKATSYLNIGLLYNNMGDYSLALEQYSKCLEYARLLEKDDPSLMGKVLNNIGAVYMNQHKNEDALKFFRQSVVYKEKAGNKKDLASTYNNIGSIFLRKDNDSALFYFGKSLRLREEENDKRGLGIVHKNLGETYVSLKKYAEAEKEFQLSLAFRESVNDQTGMASSLLALGSLYHATGDYRKALGFLVRGDSLANKTGSLSHRLDAAIQLSKVYRQLGQPEKAIRYSDIALDLKDSLLDEASDRHSAEMSARYDLEQQSRELEQLKMVQREDAIKAESERSIYRLLIISGVVVLLLIVGFFLLRQRENRKAQARLQFAYNQIESKNKDITDSIRYAKRIQQAILPEDEAFRQAFPDSFVIYRPKDIVSGDFYWYHQAGDTRLVAVADCTGHGVPGAFMSVLGSSLLTAVSTEQREISPGRILQMIDEGIRSQLHQDSQSNTYDSMDIALCAWNEKDGRLVFAGANRPIILYRNKGSFELIKPNKFSVGGDSDRVKQFDEHVIQLAEGDIFYLFSDGFADQFGGPRGKKFKSSQFRTVLAQVAGLDISKQGRELAGVFDAWKGGFEQVDDICVVGIRV